MLASVLLLAMAFSPICAPALWSRSSGLYGVLLVLASGLLIGSCVRPQKASGQRPRSLGKLDGLLILSIVVGSTVLRMWHLSTVPPGINIDEAIDGLQGASLWSGEVLPDAAGLPCPRWPLWRIILGIATSMGGVTIGSVRSPAALAGISSVALMFLLLRSWLGLLEATISAGFLATSFWHVHLSRYGTSNIIVVPETLLVCWLLLLRRNHERDAALMAGVLAGISCWDYPAAWSIPAIGFWLLLCNWFCGPDDRPTSASRLLRFGTGFFFSILPMLIYFHGGLERARIVGHAAWSEIPRHFVTCIANLFVDSSVDPLPWLNFPFGAARCSRLEVIALIGGLSVILSPRLLDRLTRLSLGGWLVIGFLPEALAAGGMNLPRGVAEFAPLAILGGLSAHLILNWKQEIRIPFLIMFWTANGILTSDRLFRMFALDPQVRNLYMEPAVAAAKKLHDLSSKSVIQLFPLPGYASDPVNTFLLWEDIRNNRIQESPLPRSPGSLEFVFRDLTHDVPVLFLFGDMGVSPNRYTLLNSEDVLSPGRSLSDSHRYDEAATYFRKMIGRVSSFGMAHVELARVLLKLNKRDQAYAELRTAGEQGVPAYEIAGLVRLANGVYSSSKHE